MNNTAPGAVAPSRTHPAIIVAAIAVIAFAAVGIAALTGYLPIAGSVSTPVNMASPAQQQGTVPDDSLSAQYGGPTDSASSVTETIEPAKAAPPAAVALSTPAPAPAPAPAPKFCRNCGTVSDVTPIERKGEGSGVGAVLGGVVGGVLGHQVGSGRGRDAATVAGALGGAYVGNQVEKNKNTIVSWEVRVRLEDGTNQVMRYPSEPAFRVGDRVKVQDGRLLARN